MIRRLTTILAIGLLSALIGLSFNTYAHEEPLIGIYPNMVIEWLKFKVSPDLREFYLEKDAQIWTTALKRYPGFIDKHTWLNPNQDDEVVFVIRWATRDQWKAIPEDELAVINQQFDDAFGATYDMVESKEFYPQE